jgi:Arc/MetJ-type ribon-helix-helix transcriptional regulator
MTQLVARVDEELIDAIDELIAAGIVSTRSEAVRRGLQELVDQTRRRRTAEAIVSGYEAIPQTEEEWGWADDSTVRMISEESW